MVKRILTAGELFKYQHRIDTFREKMVGKEPFLMVDNRLLTFEFNQHNKKELSRLYNHIKGTSYKFLGTDNNYYRLSSFIKTLEFGAKRSMNSYGRGLINSVERATVLSLLENILKPQDTKEALFINNPDAFVRWSPTFTLTKKAVKSILGNKFNKKYNITHEFNDKFSFLDIIKDFCKKANISQQVWNPADIWLIKTNKVDDIKRELNRVINTNNKELVNNFNSTIYKLYKEKSILPISLKQVTQDEASIEYSNIPNLQHPKYNICIDKLICNIKLDTDEIGTFSFKNTDLDTRIVFQTKGYPAYAESAQTEVVSDGAKTGGRVGKVPVNIIKETYEKYNFNKIKPKVYFEKNLGDTLLSQVNEWVEMYKVVYNHKSTHCSLSVLDFEEYILNALPNLSGNSAKIFKHKIQGLYMQYFLIINEKDVSTIVNDYVLGAKKVSKDSGFFVKIY